MEFTNKIYGVMIMLSFLLIVACNRKDGLNPDYRMGCTGEQVARTEVAATSGLVGRWKLKQTVSGWGKIERLSENVEISIDDKQKVILYENGRESLQFQLTINGSPYLRYNISDQSTKSGNVPAQSGDVSVCSQVLILGNASVDGVDFVYTRE